MPPGDGTVKGSVGFSGVDSKEVPEDLGINLAFHGGDPIEAVVCGGHPAGGAEFLGVVEADGGFGINQIPKEVVLFLSGKAFFFSALREKIPIGSAAGYDAVGVGAKAQFFDDLAGKGVGKGFSRVDAALGKLPASGPVAPFTDEDFPRGIPQDERNIRAVGGHGGFYAPEHGGKASVDFQEIAENLPGHHFRFAWKRKSWNPFPGSRRAGSADTDTVTMKHSLLILLVSALAAWAQEPTATPARLERMLWTATLPGGEYNVKLGDIISVSLHEYIVDNAARVAEVNIDTPGNGMVRFYCIEPNVPKAPGGLGQSVLNKAEETANDFLSRTKMDETWSKVMKSYPATTHAHTIEYRIPDRKTLQALFDSVKECWVKQRGGVFKP